MHFINKTIILKKFSTLYLHILLPNIPTDYCINSTSLPPNQTIHPSQRKALDISCMLYIMSHYILIASITSY